MKRILSVLAVIAISLFVTSCSVESKTKSFYKKAAEIELEALELEVAEAETYVEYYEYVAGLNDEEFAEWVENNEDWSEDVEDEYEEILDELDEKQEDLRDEMSDIEDDLYYKMN